MRTFSNADCRLQLPALALQGHRPLRRPRRALPVRGGRPQPSHRVCRRSPTASVSRSARACRSPDARAAVLEQRRSRGMVLDAADHDTWSCGSFFTNPILRPRRSSTRSRSERPSGWASTRRATAVRRAGRTRQDERGVAHREGWLRQGPGLPGAGGPLDQAHAGGDQPGRGHDGGRARARPEVRDGVEDAFGIRLVNEPVLVGEQL